MLDQYGTCLNDHATCRLNNTDSNFHPTRLIDVGQNQDRSVRLCEHSRGEYAALSHCWGTVQPFTLTKETCDELHDGISLDQLPKTFQDAIEVARRFCIQYLWIDSL
jgi:hypothetical protein